MADDASVFGMEPENLDRLFLSSLDSESPERDGTPDILRQALGSWIDDYKLVEVLGEGGMGIVYLAEQEEPIRRQVALKVIKPGMDSKQVVMRFEAERQALALLSHANIAQVYHAGTTELGRPYFVMEHVEGPSITEYCDRQRLTIAARLGLFRQVCEAVHHAHQKGILHRDIKPSNILVAEQEGVPVPKVIDFGIAKATEYRLTEQTCLTQQGHVTGTPAYMSPEQADSARDEVDTRSDIYSLGVLLYELLTGCTPFDTKDLSGSGLDRMRKIIRERTPIKPSTRLTQLQAIAKSEHRIPKSEIATELDWIVMKALEKDRTRRYETADAFRLDIERFLNNEPVTAVAPSPMYQFRKFTQRNRLAVTAAIAVMTAVLAGLGFSLAFYARERVARQEAETSEQRALEARYASDMRVALNALVNGDAKLVMTILKTHSPANDGQPDLRGWEWRYLYGQLHREQREAYTHNGRVNEVTVSPDGRLLAVSGRGLDESTTIAILDATTLERRRTLQGPDEWPSGMRFSTDSGTLIAEIGSYVMQENLITGDLRTQAIENARPVLLSRNGDFLIGLSQLEGDPLPNYYFQTVSVKDDAEVGRTPPYLLPNRWRLDHEVRLSPDGKLVTLCCAGQRLRFFSVPELRESCCLEVASDVCAVAWSPDGSILATGYEYQWDIDLWDVTTGKRVHRIENALTSPCYDIVFSPDGSLLAFSEENCLLHVWAVEEKIWRDVFITEHTAERAFQHLAFYPNSRLLAGGGGDGTVRIYDVSTSPTSDLRRISQAHEIWTLAFSPDGSLLTTLGADGIIRLFDAHSEKLVQSLNDGQAVAGPRVEDEPDPPIRFSRDGGTLAAEINGDTVAVYDMPSGRLRCTLEHGFLVRDLSISPDGKTIATAGRGKLIFWDAETGEAQETMTDSNIDMGAVAFSPGVQSRWVAFGGGDALKLMHLDTRECKTAPAESQRNETIAFSHDGRILAYGLAGQVQLYEIPSLKLLDTLEGSRGWVPNVSFSPDDRTIAIPSWGGQVQLWSRTVQADVGRLPLAPDWVSCAIFSPDGCTIAVATRHHGVVLFRAPPTGVKQL